MPSYMNIVVLALAASNVSVAMSAPIPSREAREQNPRPRDKVVGESGDLVPKPGAGYPPPGYRPPGYGYEHTEGTPPPEGETPYTKGTPPPEGGTPPPKGTPHSPSTPPQPEDGPPKGKPEKAMVKGGGGWRSRLAQFGMGTLSSMLGISLLRAMFPGTFGGSGSRPSGPATGSSSVTSSSSGGSYITDSQYYQGGPYPQGAQLQRRAVDYGKRADFFEASDKNRRATSHLDLLTREDLGEALKLFSRVLDELD